MPTVTAGSVPVPWSCQCGPVTMCTYYYLHHHHSAPCTRDIEFAFHYVFCPAATFDETCRKWDPCQSVSYYDQQNGNPGVDFNNPCASGGCLASAECSLGQCRLEELNGLWVCCQCGLGGNTYRFCNHPMKKSPDTLCYHQCCQDCQPDNTAPHAAEGGSGSGQRRARGQGFR